MNVICGYGLSKPLNFQATSLSMALWESKDVTFGATKASYIASPGDQYLISFTALRNVPGLANCPLRDVAGKERTA